MAGCSNYDTYIETGMQSLKDEKYSDATMCLKKQKKRNREMKRNHIKKWPRKWITEPTALKDGKYLEAKDIANEVLQMKKDDALETAVTSNAENMLQKAKDVEKKVNERVAKRRKVEEEGIDKLIKAVDSIDDVKEKEKKVSEALDKAEEAQAKIEAKKNK